MESLSDIEKELRSLSKSDEYSVRAKYAEHQPTVRGKPILLYFAEIADRIEAAWKREKAEIEADALAVGGCVEASRHKECGTQKEVPMKSLNEIVAELRMGDDGGKPAYRIGRADKVEVSMPSGTPVRSYVIEYVTIKELADWIEAAVARERGPGNAAAMREALELALDALLSWLNGTIDRNKNREAIKAIRAALSAPARNCDKMPDIDNLTMHDLANSPCKSTLEYASREELLALVRWLLAPAAERKGGGILPGCDFVEDE